MPLLEILEQPAHHLSHLPRILDQIVLFIHRYIRERRSARERVAVVSQTTIENILLKMIRDLTSHPDCTELHVSTRQTLCHRDQIRNYFPVIDREPFPRTTKTGHHFISDQENPVFVT